MTETSVQLGRKSNGGARKEEVEERMVEKNQRWGTVSMSRKKHRHARPRQRRRISGERGDAAADSWSQKPCREAFYLY
jgi:hypothetical protein